MRTLKKTVVLLLLTATAVAGGCDGGHYSDHGYDQVPTQRVIVEHRDQDSWSDIIAMTQRQQMINMQRQWDNQQMMNDTMDRMRDTMGRFGGTVDSANRMRRRNNR